MQNDYELLSIKHILEEKIKVILNLKYRFLSLFMRKLKSPDLTLIIDATRLLNYYRLMPHRSNSNIYYNLHALM